MLYFCCTESQNRLCLSHQKAYFRSVLDVWKPLTIWPTDKLTSMEIKWTSINLGVIAADCCTFAVLGRKIALASLENGPTLPRIPCFLKLVTLCPTNKPTSFEMGLFCAPRGTRTLGLLVRNLRDYAPLSPTCPNKRISAKFFSLYCSINPLFPCQSNAIDVRLMSKALCWPLRYSVPDTDLTISSAAWHAL